MTHVILSREDGEESGKRRAVPRPDSSRSSALGMTLALFLLAFACHRAAPVQPPATDIILVTLDTTRADALGYAGNTRVKTPFLDALAARGLVFVNAHAHNVVTLPSHVNILTGLYPYQHGVHDNAGFTLDPKHLTVATMLRNAGWTTGAFIGAFPLDSRFGLNQGFDTYDDNYGKGEATVDFVEQERRASAVLEPATRWWKSNDGRKRFLWIHLYDAHAPYAPPEPFLSQYRDNEYLGEVAYVDDSLSKFLGPILAADPGALVVVTADHGEALGDHGEKTHGLLAYEATLKVPLVVARAGIAHRVEAAYVRHVDIVPTILESAGVAVPKDLPGRSLLHPIAAEDSYFESLSANLNRGWAPLTGVIHHDAKYIDLPVAELYDLPRDPHETTNVLDQRRRDAEQAKQLLAPMQAALVAAPRAPISSEEAARLRSLGYVSGSAPATAHYTAADDPKNLIALDNAMHDAIDAYERHDNVRALQLARDVVAKRPSMTAGREILAFMLRQNERVAEAIRELEIIVRDPHADDADRVQLALLYCETGRARAAIDLLGSRAASTKDPDVLNAYGVALSDDGRQQDAVEQFNRVLSLDSNNAPALQNLGIVALRAGDAVRAHDDLNRALELNPRLPLALNTLGVVAARGGDYAGAVGLWRRAVDIDPRQYDALFNMGLVQARTGATADARASLTAFLKSAPRDRYAADLATARQALSALR